MHRSLALRIAVSAAVAASFSTGTSAQSPPVDPEDGWFATNLVLPPSLDVGAVAHAPGTLHQGLLRGVNPGYDWYPGSVLHAGNAPPATWEAVTGWGQAMWRADWAPTPEQAIELKDSTTLLCRQSPDATIRWHLVQSGGFEGGTFDPSYTSNVSKPANVTPLGPGAQRVHFSGDRAYHFWPGSRASIYAIGGDSVCGLVYLIRARVVLSTGAPLPAGSSPALLIGGGADYWETLGSPYPSNASIGIGQLRALSGKWRWYGFTTASWPALHKLDRDGFLPGP